jgi:hypothetical protein
MQPIVATPINAYRNKVTGIPLNGGQVQGQITGYNTTTDSVTSPTTFQNIVFISSVTPGTYTVNWTVTLAGTIAAAEANNFQLYNGSTVVATSVNAAAAGTYPQAPVTFTVTSGVPDIKVLSGAATPTTGAVYGATVQGNSFPLTLQVGPQGLGTVWYPIQITLSTTTGQLDTSLANIYLGPLVTPATLVGTGFGNGTYALAIPSMTPGQTIIIVWTGGTAGDAAAANIIGAMDALTI